MAGSVPEPIFGKPLGLTMNGTTESMTDFALESFLV